MSKASPAHEISIMLHQNPHGPVHGTSRRVATRVLLLSAVVLTAACSRPAAAADVPSSVAPRALRADQRADWMRDGRYGVFMQYQHRILLGY